jgi:3-carboxy-cis,cis-muconate cycloisomerase
MGLSPFDHPFLSGLLGNEEIAAAFGAEAEIAAMLAFEAGLAQALERHGYIPATSAARIVQTCAGFVPDMSALGRATRRDGVVVPELVHQLRAAVGDGGAEHVHVGATSQDVIDTALMLRLKPVLAIVAERLGDLVNRLETLDASFGARPLMAHTRMQAAIPITIGDRLRSWSEPVREHRTRLAALTLPLQFGGAAGTLDKFGTQGPPVRSTLAGILGLADRPQWHSQRAVIVDISHALALITGSLGKFGQDVGLMAQEGQLALTGGSSSSMPHKQNPVAAEVLVALARFGAAQAGCLQNAMVHEQERSGAAWTLEWLALPQLVLACGSSVSLAAELLGSLRRLGPAESSVT